MTQGAPVDSVDQVRVGRFGQQQRELLPGLVTAQRGQLEHVDVRQAPDSGEPVERGRGGAGVLQAPRSQDRPPVAPGQHVLEQVEGAGVGPVQVLDQHREGTDAGECRHGRLDGVEQALPGPVALGLGLETGCVQLGQEGPQRAGHEGRTLGQRLLDPSAIVDRVDRSHHVSDRQERDLRRQGQAAAGGHEDVTRIEGDGGVDQSGLSHPGLAGDQQQAAPGLEVLAGEGELAAAAGYPGLGTARRSGGCAGGEPQGVEATHLAVHRLDQHLEDTPGGQPG
jgi:hypothetical protein